MRCVSGVGEEGRRRRLARHIIVLLRHVCVRHRQRNHVGNVCAGQLSLRRVHERRDVAVCEQDRLQLLPLELRHILVLVL